MQHLGKTNQLALPHLGPAQVHLFDGSAKEFEKVINIAYKRLMQAARHAQVVYANNPEVLQEIQALRVKVAMLKTTKIH